MKKHPLKTTRIIPTSLPLEEQAKKQIENDVHMGVLKDMTEKANQDLWLAPMIIILKKDNSPRRVIDFSNLNKLCKRSAETTSNTQHMATALPTPEA